ncbi:hypothetical protein AMTR_s00128p00117360 [Amborella trichopoda]|uniref:Uncharacterized protein n=1 Tax=Amborella trichopoda TaxID=13333 RepID=W1NPG8_AMBTC|nr:hypothetical protein AMTR_s00128p00117360 [Amborella trichopoda]
MNLWKEPGLTCRLRSKGSYLFSFPSAEGALAVLRNPSPLTSSTVATLSLGGHVAAAAPLGDFFFGFIPLSLPLPSLNRSTLSPFFSLSPLEAGAPSSSEPPPFPPSKSPPPGIVPLQSSCGGTLIPLFYYFFSSIHPSPLTIAAGVKRPLLSPFVPNPISIATSSPSFCDTWSYPPLIDLGDSQLPLAAESPPNPPSSIPTPAEPVDPHPPSLLLLNLWTPILSLPRLRAVSPMIPPLGIPSSSSVQWAFPHRHPHY